MPFTVKSYSRGLRDITFYMHPEGRMRLQICSDNVVRVTYTLSSKLPGDSSLSVINTSLKQVDWKIRREPSRITVATDKLKASVDLDTGLIEFYDLYGSPIIVEDSRSLTSIELPDGETYSVEQTFRVSMDERFYGLGQHPGIFDYRGRSITLIQRNWDVAIPFLVSSRGYGILWDNYSMTRFENFADNGFGKIKFWSEASDAIDYYLIYGPSIDDVISSYRKLTGDPPLLPIWAYGFWQSKERYKTQDEILEVARTFRSKGIPIDIIVLDWKYWGKYGWNAFKFDEESFPDPAGMVKDLHELGIRILISIWPIFGEETDIYKDMESRGFICPGTRCYDPFNEEARKLYWEYIRRSFFDIGVDGWWLDATEPETGVGWASFYTPFHSSTTAIGSGARYLNAYSLMTTRAVYEGQRSISDKRVVILTRSAFTGQQRYSAITWSGDICHDWGILREQIAAGLNFSISGIPYWTTDIGGFFSGNPETDSYREIFARWFQWGSFCPIFRVHGTTYAKEPWRFGSEYERILVKYIRLRYRLLPYIYSHAWRVTKEGYTFMRPLIMDFRMDTRVADIDDQYMFGSAIMVSPVTLPKIKARWIYLPRSICGWYDFWTGRHMNGGVWIETPTPIDIIPLHVKAGSIIPMAPPLQYAKEKPWNPIEVRVYRGADASFTLYEDDGETYSYERGEYSLTPITWLEDEGRLIIGAREGGYPGMLRERSFHIVFVRDGYGIGVEETVIPDRVVKYDGKEVEVKIS
ncbi:MAG: glycoside hydrolase family 31 protein [Candidatus Bathyarchaeia archaeon]